MTIFEHFKNFDFLFDSHAHLNTGNYENNLDEVIKRAKDNGVEKIFDIGVDLKSSIKAVEKGATDSSVAPFVGIDPEVFEPGSEMFIGFDIGDLWFEEQKESLRKLISNNYKIVKGIGETGMDYYHIDKLNVEDFEKSAVLQKRLFIDHLEIAEEFRLPVSIHSRGCEKLCLIIVKNSPKVKGIFHSYTGDYDTAVKILESGWGLGVNGIITFKNSEPLRAVYRKILGQIPQAPEEITPKYFYSKGIFFETDSPYLSPEGKRGERNEPANVKIVYDYFRNMLSKSDH